MIGLDFCLDDTPFSQVCRLVEQDLEHDGQGAPAGDDLPPCPEPLPTHVRVVGLLGRDLFAVEAVPHGARLTVPGGRFRRYWLPLPDEVSTAIWHDAIDAAAHHVPYDYAGLWLPVWADVVAHQPPAWLCDAISRHKEFCSQLADTLCQAHGVDLLAGYRPITVSPARLERGVVRFLSRKEKR